MSGENGSVVLLLVFLAGFGVVLFPDFKTTLAAAVAVDSFLYLMGVWTFVFMIVALIVTALFILIK